MKSRFTSLKQFNGNQTMINQLFEKDSKKGNEASITELMFVMKLNLTNKQQFKSKKKVGKFENFVNKQNNFGFQCLLSRYHLDLMNWHY